MDLKKMLDPRLVLSALGTVPPMLKVGDKAPSFEVKAHDGSTVKLDDYKDKKLVLWFYPAADTPG